VSFLEHQPTKENPERGDGLLGANEVLVIRLKEGETYSRNCNGQWKVNAVGRNAHRQKEVKPFQTVPTNGGDAVKARTASHARACLYQ
jgi:hypothetical protein